jgi:hypothetical protein
MNVSQTEPNDSKRFTTRRRTTEPCTYRRRREAPNNPAQAASRVETYRLALPPGIRSLRNRIRFVLRSTEILDHQGKGARPENPERLFRLQTKTISSWRATNGRPARKSRDTLQPTIYLHRRGLFWTILRAAWKKSCETIWCDFHLLVYTCNPYRSGIKSRHRLIHQRDEKIHRRKRQPSRNEIR